MSRYKIIETEFKSLTSLLAALADLGWDASKVEVASDPLKPSLSLVGYQGDTRPERASLRIPRQHVGNVSNDVGFAWNGRAYTAIVSEFDQTNGFKGETTLPQIKQRYAVNEVKRQAKARGYTVVENRRADGTIGMTLKK